jgi:16S rRNA (guanine1207-N2)-methyltransferase
MARERRAAAPGWSHRPGEPAGQSVASPAERRLTLPGGTTAVLPYHEVYAEDAVDPATHLLAERAAELAGQQVVLAGAGSALVAIAAAQAGTRLTVVDTNCAALAYAERALALNRASATCLLLEDLWQLPAAAFDAALAPLKWFPGSRAFELAMAALGQALRSGGTLYVGGCNDRGIEHAATILRALYGTADAVAYRKGCRVLVSRRGAQPPTFTPEPPEVVEVEVRGVRVRLFKQVGIFAGGELDEGTRLLIEALDVRADDRILDLGCGSGVVGMVAACLAARTQVWMADADATAVALARKNLALNGRTNATVLLSDAYAALEGLHFDLIASNPPVHAGRVPAQAIARRFIGGAPDFLASRGRLYVVGPAFLPYEAWLAERFARVGVVADTQRYRVVRAEKPLVGRRARQTRT